MEHIVSDKEHLVYWEKFDEPKIITNIFGKEEKITGEWKCDNPLVEKAWFILGHGIYEEDKNLYMNLLLLLKDGTRKDFKVTNLDDQEQAIKWLQSIQNQ